MNETEALGASLPIVGARVTQVLVDSERTVIIFDSGAVLEGENGWELTWNQ